MRCLHCGKRLSLLRKLADGEFCSSEHRHMFQQQQSDVAMSRLMEVQKRLDLKRHEEEEAEKRTAAAAIAALTTDSSDPAVAQFLREAAVAMSWWRLSEPACRLIDPENPPSVPPHERAPRVRGAKAGEVPPVPNPLAPSGLPGVTEPGAATWATSRLEDRLPGAAAPHLSVRGLGNGPALPVRGAEPLEATPEQRPIVLTEANGLWVLRPGVAPRLKLALIEDGPPAPPKKKRRTVRVPEAAERVMTVRFPMPARGKVTRREAVARTLEVASKVSLTTLRFAALQAELSPSVASPIALEPQGCLRTTTIIRTLDVALEPMCWTAATPRISAECTLPACEPELQGVALSVHSLAAGRQAERAISTEALTGPLSSQSLLPAMPSRRTLPTPVEPGLLRVNAPAAIAHPGETSLMACEPEAQFTAPAPVWTSERTLVPDAIPVVARVVEAQPATVAAVEELPVLAQVQEEAAEAENAPSFCDLLLLLQPPLPQKPECSIHFPSLKDRPSGMRMVLPTILRRMPKVDFKPDRPDGSGAHAYVHKPQKDSLLQWFKSRLTVPPGGRFWSHAPADLKWVAVGVPLVLALVIYSWKASPPKEQGGSQTATASRPATESVIAARLNTVQKAIMNRAAIRLMDDFRGGLGSWQGTEGWAKSWRYSDSTFLEPGQLALYSPSLGMTDYSLEFLGQIEKKSLNWVFRAKDTKNYYVMRIVLTRPGPIPLASIMRYAVIDGKEGPVKTLPLPLQVRGDTMYRVRMEIKGNNFSTYIQDQLVDNFSDDRLTGGGVGFFSPKGDQALLRWVEVMYQYDYLGRLCAVLAPYSMPAEGRRAE